MAHLAVVTAAAVKCASTLLNSISHTFEDYSTLSDTPSIPYRQFIRKVKTGDLLLTSSTELTSVTRPLMKTRWSHSGIAYWDDGVLYEWSCHSEEEGLLNKDGLVLGGTQLVPLDHLVSDTGSIFWRPVAVTENNREAIRSIVQTMKYKLSFSTKLEFMTYFSPLLPNIISGHCHGINCSQCVALTYKESGVIDMHKHIGLYTPGCFAEHGDARWNVPVSRTHMVVGYDTSRLISLPSLQNKK